MIKTSNFNDNLNHNNKLINNSFTRNQVKKINPLKEMSASRSIPPSFNKYTMADDNNAVINE